MKTFLVAVAVLLMSVPAIADTYTGVVSQVKHFHNGGIAVDLGGKWPDQAMTFYVPPADAATVGVIPPEGAKVTATGTTEQYRGKPEIKIHKADQWKW